MTGKEPIQDQQLTFLHLEILNISPLIPTAVLTIKPVPKEFADELIKLMAKYKIKRIDAILIPCNQKHDITINVDEKKDEVRGDSAWIGP